MRTNATMAAAAASSSSGQQDEGGGGGSGGGGASGGGSGSGGGAAAAPPGHHLVIHRKPPGPWTETETNHLIDAYQEKWYTLKRGQLKARHWEEVANQVFLRCGGIEPSKSSVQCRHKIEKLRKRYRTEKQQQQSSPSWSPSKWVFFERMDLLENGPAPPRATESIPNGRQLTAAAAEQHDSDTTDNNNHHHHPGNPTGSGYPRGAFHHKTVYHSTLQSDDEAAAFLCLRNGGGDADSGGRASPSPRFSVKRRKPPDDPESAQFQPQLQPQAVPQGLSELASVVRSLGEGFMRIEQMKIEMQRDNERMRMEMEMKRTEMIVESQQHIADVIAKAFASKKKTKKLQSPDL
uniref:Myb-like domain-containing protein n=1 Tax=Araucaria cunninghamii TaxID=56994 RepID=A0A0D6R4E0_ARACU